MNNSFMNIMKEIFLIIFFLLMIYNLYTMVFEKCYQLIFNFW